jgi:SAM-dependent methyltransferase
MQEKTLEYYIAKQKDGHKGTENYAMTNSGYIKLMNFLQEKIPEAGIILDIGCNTGYECGMIKTEKRIVIGIDLGEEFITKAKERGVDARVMDMHNLDFAPGYFDAVYVNNTLEHTYDAVQALSEIYRVLKDNGIAIICMPADCLNMDFVGGNWDKSLHLWKPTYAQFLNTLKFIGFKFEAEMIDMYEKFGLKNESSNNIYMVAVCTKL